jgi:hypothetical protein
MIINPSSEIYKLVGYKILHRDVEKTPQGQIETSNDYTVELSEEAIQKSKSYSEKVKEIQKSIDDKSYQLTDDMIDTIAQDITGMFI